MDVWTRGLNSPGTRIRMTPIVLGSLTVGLVFLLAACEGHDPSRDAGAEEDSSVLADEVVQFGFHPTVNERRQLNQAVQSIRYQLGVDHVAATVRRFGQDPDRYFIFVIPPPEHNEGNSLFSVVWLAGGVPELSPPFDTGIPFGPSGVSVEDLADIDGDGLSDAIYCAFSQNDDGRGEVRAVGFADGGWYSIEESAWTVRFACHSDG